MMHQLQMKMLSTGRQHMQPNQVRCNRRVDASATTATAAIGEGTTNDIIAILKMIAVIFPGRKINDRV